MGKESIEIIRDAHTEVLRQLSTEHKRIVTQLLAEDKIEEARAELDQVAKVNDTARRLGESFSRFAQEVRDLGVNFLSFEDVLRYAKDQEKVSGETPEPPFFHPQAVSGSSITEQQVPIEPAQYNENHSANGLTPNEKRLFEFLQTQSKVNKPVTKTEIAKLLYPDEGESTEVIGRVSVLLYSLRKKLNSLEVDQTIKNVVPKHGKAPGQYILIPIDGLAASPQEVEKPDINGQLPKEDQPTALPTGIEGEEKK